MMKHRHTYRLTNGNEKTIWSGYSPDQTFAIIQDRQPLKNVKEVVESAKKDGWDKIEEGR